MRQLVHDKLNMIFMTLARRHISAQSQAAPAICSFEFQSADEFKYEVTKSGTPMRA